MFQNYTIDTISFRSSTYLFLWKGYKRHTKAIKNNLDPKWDTDFDLKLDKPVQVDEVLEVIVYDEGLFGLRYATHVYCSDDLTLGIGIL